MKHYDERHRLPDIAARDVQLVGAGPGPICVEPLEELPALRNDGGRGRACCCRGHGAWHAAEASGWSGDAPKRILDRTRMRGWRGPGYLVHGHPRRLDRLLCTIGGVRHRRGGCAAEGALDDRGRLGEPALAREARGLRYAGRHLVTHRRVLLSSSSRRPKALRQRRLHLRARPEGAQHDEGVDGRHGQLRGDVIGDARHAQYLDL